MSINMHMKYYFWSFVFLASCLQLSFQCHSGYIWGEPNSQSVSVGKSVSFYCYGRGSHLYWFIDGINTVNMTCQEMSDRRLSTNGSYNHGPPNNGDCDYQESYLTMAGNCLNNNTEIYCVILGRYSPSNGGGNKTSSVASLVVKGDGATLINQFTAVQTKIDSLLLYWKLESISNLNYTQTITVEEGTTTVYSMELHKLDQYHIYNSEKATFDPCVQYNITLNIDATCISDTLTIVRYLSGKPMKPRLVSVLDHASKLITFQYNSSLCQGSLPSTILILLNDNNGDLISSDVIPWNNVTTISDELYQTELIDINLKDNGYYYLLLVSQSEHGQTVSEPFTISTFDVIDAQYSFNNDTAEFCVTCIFATESQAIGCIAVLSTTTNIYSMKITRDTSGNNGSGCVIVGDSGLYSISVYDWEGNNGDMILRNEPAVKNSMFLFGNVAIISVKQTTKSDTTDHVVTSIVVSKTANRTTSITAYSSMIGTVLQQQDGNNTLMVTVFAVLFGLSMMFLLIFVVLVIAILIRQKKTSKSSDGATWRLNDTTSAGGIQMNMAYELHSTNTKSAATGVEDHDYTFNDPVQNERYQTSPAPTNVGNAHIYANVEYTA